MFKKRDTAEGRMTQALGCFLVLAITIISILGLALYKLGAFLLGLV